MTQEEKSAFDTEISCPFLPDEVIQAGSSTAG
jgi:hypothetical protein